MKKKYKLITSVATVMLSSLLLVACSTTTDKTDTQNSEKSSLTVKQQKELDKVTTTYRDFVEKQINQLLVDTEKWSETLKSGDLEEAKKQYPIIRMTYERSEPIAESFGELDVKIDYRLVDYVDEHNNEDGWSGFHRIERILWTENTTEGTEKYAEQLVNDIKELIAKVSTVDVTPDLMTTGAVDLLNEVATSKITGEEEIFSHTDLYDFRANIEGAETIFTLLKPLLEEKDKQLVAELTADFKAVHTLLDQYMIDALHYKSYTELTEQDTKALAEAVTKLGEPLSQMGIVLE